MRDENAEVNIPHMTKIKNGAETDEKSKSMKLHCNHFLCKYCENLGINPSITSLDQIKYEDITADLVGKFSAYLVTEATVRNAPGGALIA